MCVQRLADVSVRPMCPSKSEREMEREEREEEREEERFVVRRGSAYEDIDLATFEQKMRFGQNVAVDWDREGQSCVVGRGEARGVGELVCREIPLNVSVHSTLHPSDTSAAVAIATTTTTTTIASAGSNGGPRATTTTITTTNDNKQHIDETFVV